MLRLRLLLLLAGSLADSAAAAPRNLLFLSVEDWAVRSIGCYGNPDARTPHLDRLAARGIRFDRAYAQATVCNPSRASFVTGLYPDSTHLFTNADVMDRVVPPAAPSLAAALARRPGSYLAQTGKLVHKWDDAGRFAQGFHLIEYAHRYDLPPGFTGILRKLPHGAIDTGDDVEQEAFFLPDRAVVARLRQLHAARDQALAAGVPDNWETRKPFQQLFAEQIGDSGLDAGSMEDGRIARSTANLLGELAARRQPFFLSVGLYSTHTPLLAPKEFVDLHDPARITLTPATADRDRDIPAVAKRNGQNYDIFNGLYPEYGPTPERQRAAVAAYYACSSYVDAQIGLILDALARHGLADDTAVIVFADHGFHLGEHGLWSKFTLFEESTRVPLVIYVPGAAGNGRACSSLVELVDLFPTLCDLWQVEKPAALQGRSLVPLLADPSLPHKPAIYSVITLGGLGRSVRTTTHRYAEYHRSRAVPAADTTPLASELYDLVADPHEHVNLTADPAHRPARERLGALLRRPDRARRGAP